MEDDYVQRIAKDEVDFEKFWAVAPQGQAWLMALQNLLRGHEDSATDYLIGVTPEGTFIYYLNREAFPAEVMSRFTGIPVEKFTDRVHKLTLPALEKPAQADQPKPTVDYWGFA